MRLMTVFGILPVVVAALLGALTIPAVAQVADQRRSVHTEVARPQLQSLREWLRDRAAGTVPPLAFKVPADGITQVICNINPEGIRCYDSLVSLQCPGSVTVQTPSGNTTVPVTCTGPDRDGNCDCEFRDAS